MKSIQGAFLDISAAFDKVWHEGLRYKLLNMRQPLHPSLLKILSHYLKYRTAKIVIGNEPGEPFTLNCGVPQGGCLSPTLYTFYNSDMPTPDADDPKEENVSYADDLTQIITYPTGSFRMLASYTQRAIQRMNAYEKRWKIKTNQEKFNIIYMFRIKRNTVSCIHTEDGLLRYSEHGKVLGLKLNNKGLHQQVGDRRQMAANKLKTLTQLSNLSTTNKLKLYKTVVRPTLTYPPVPLNTVSNTQMRQLQLIQNDALRLVVNARRADRLNVQTLHEQLDIEPINVYLHKLARNVWTMVDNNPTVSDRIQRHAPPSPPVPRQYFESSRRKALGAEPPPIYRA